MKGIILTAAVLLSTQEFGVGEETGREVSKRMCDEKESHTKVVVDTELYMG